MNVLYDISSLGRYHGESINKTGIARVVETLAYQLADDPECHLKLCANEFLLGSLDYAQSDARLKSVGFPHRKSGVFFQRKQRNIEQRLDTVAGPARVITRAQRKLIHYAVKFGKFSTQTLDVSSLRSADIYHSTYLPVPEVVKAIKRPQRFLTIYDMIPVLFPEHCSTYLQHLFGEILGSIDAKTWLVSISEATKADFCNHLNLDPSRVFVTPLAADPALFYPNNDPQQQAAVRQKHHIADAPYILSLCTIEPRKNIDHVIRSFVKLMQEQHLTDLQLVLAGRKGWNFEHIFREIDGAEALKDNIVVTGFVANEDLAALYSGALAFVFPSLYEGFGLPPLEAMQCGTPVITSNTSSLPEVVGEAGIMLDPHDVDGLCQSLLSLYQDAGLRARMSAQSVERARLFSWKRCAQDTVNAYKAALKS